MGYGVVFIGKGNAFMGDFRKLVEDCGYEVRAGKGPTGGFEDLCVYEVADKDDLNAHSRMVGPPPGRAVPRLLPLTRRMAPAIEGGRSSWASSPGSSAEDASFLLNKGLFYKRCSKGTRGYRWSPVELKSGPRTIRTNASLLSRDGMFIVT